MDEKGKQIISYIFGWIGGLIVLFAVKDNTKKTNLHASQAIILSVGYIVIRMVYYFIPISIPFFKLVLYALYLGLAIWGIVKACNNEDPALPVIGDLAKQMFGNKINSGRDDAAPSASAQPQQPEKPAQVEQPKEDNNNNQQ